MSIYTKTGDKGKTFLLNGDRTTKDCVRLCCVGSLDELNANLGVALSFCVDKKYKKLVEQVQKIQKDLFLIGSEIASLQINGEGSNKYKLIDLVNVLQLEKEIDSMWQELPELKNFVLPGGSSVGSFFHVARTVCRRTERELVGLGKEIEMRAEVYAYLNRLSDYLFATARWINWKEWKEEVVV